MRAGGEQYLLTVKHADSAALQRTCSGRQVENVVKMFLEAKEHRMSRSERGNVAMLAAEFACEMGGDSSRLSGNSSRLSGTCCEDGCLEVDKCEACRRGIA